MSRRADADEVRQVEVGRPDLLGDDRAEVGYLTPPDGSVAGVQLVDGPLVLAFLVGHRPDQGDVLHCLATFGQCSATCDARQRGRDRLGRAAVAGAGLGIERLELARAAAHEQQDAGHALLAQLGGVQRDGILPAKCRGAGGAGRTPRRNVRRLTTPSRRLAGACRRGWTWLAPRRELRRSRVLTRSGNARVSASSGTRSSSSTPTACPRTPRRVCRPCGRTRPPSTISWSVGLRASVLKYEAADRLLVVRVLLEQPRAAACSP